MRIGRIGFSVSPCELSWWYSNLHSAQLSGLRKKQLQLQVSMSLHIIMRSDGTPLHCRLGWSPATHKGTRRVQGWHDPKTPSKPTKEEMCGLSSFASKTVAAGLQQGWQRA